MKIANDMLPIHEITCSFSGEVGPMFNVGEKIIILRLSGCNMSCHYCDTPETQDVSKDRKANLFPVEVVAKMLIGMVENTDCFNILVTGGEPLLYATQFNTLLCILHGMCPESKVIADLDNCQRMRRLKWQVETNGSVAFGENTMLWRMFEKTVGFVVDIKTHELHNPDYVKSLKWWMIQAFNCHERIYFKIPIEDIFDIEAYLIGLNLSLERLIRECRGFEHPWGLGGSSVHFFFAPIFNDGRVSPSLIRAITKHLRENSIIKCSGSFIHLGINMQMHKMINVP